MAGRVSYPGGMGAHAVPLHMRGSPQGKSGNNVMFTLLKIREPLSLVQSALSILWLLIMEPEFYFGQAYEAFNRLKRFTSLLMYGVVLLSDTNII